jgi:hypothetical protein
LIVIPILGAAALKQRRTNGKREVEARHNLHATACRMKGMNVRIVLVGLYNSE